MIVLPIGVRSHQQPEVTRLLGSGVVARRKGSETAIVTAHHVIQTEGELFVAIPPTQGRLSQFQSYPITQVQTAKIAQCITNPLTDLAVLTIEGLEGNITLPQFIDSTDQIAVGEPMAVIGYPYCVIGSLLETYAPCHVIALGRRSVANGVEIPELILSYQAHKGSSGSPVVRMSDGKICGIVRGSLAPPESIRVGDIPLGTDSSITYAVFAHFVAELVQQALP